MQFPSYRGEIRFEKSQHRNNRQDTEIVAIGRSNARKLWDITVEGEPHLFALASGVLTHNSNPMPESVTDRPTKSHEYVFLCSKSKKYYYDMEAIREPVKESSRERYNYVFGGAKNEHLKATVKPTAVVGTRELTKGRNKRTVWTVNTQSFSGAKYLADYVGVDGKFYKASRDCPYHGHLADCQKTSMGECGEPQDALFSNTPDIANHHAREHVGESASNHCHSSENPCSAKGNIKKCLCQEVNTDHFATFPPALITPMILAGSSPKAREHCGAPWARVVKKGLTAHDGETSTQYEKRMAANRLALLRQAARKRGGEYRNETKTVGWKPTCSCPDNDGSGKSVVFDPFMGAGTVGVVATELGRNYFGCDNNPEYVKMAEKRIRETQPGLPL